MGETGEGLDLVAIGRAGVDLYGQQVGGRLEDMTSFAKYVGGSPANTCVGAARLGLKAALISRIGADHMGRFVRETLIAEGVDVSGLVEDTQRLTALAMLGIRDANRFPLVFFRENCADMALCEADVPAALIGRARAVVLSGTHLSTPAARAASIRAARLARENGARVVFDIDYRPVLWGLAARDRGEDRFVADGAVSAVLQSVLPLCDLVVGTEEEFQILGAAPATLDALAAVRARTPALLVCKLGDQGCRAFPAAVAEKDGFGHRGFAVEVFNVVGAGDAFMAGFLRGWLRQLNLEASLELANAAGAIVVSRHGCAPAMPTWPEIEAFLAAPVRPARLREDSALEHLHWATTRARLEGDLLVLAIDHRTQFETLAREAGAPTERIGAFKSLAMRAVASLAEGEGGFGVLLDGGYGGEALAAAAELPLWTGRCIETAGSRPLAFDGGADVGTGIATWPARQVVKCLLRAHPDDEPSLRGRQERQLTRLFEACRRTGHELMLELVPPHDMANDEITVARLIDQIYALGVRPDWWKLPPSDSARTWRVIGAAVERGDGLCRGVLVLGGGSKPDAMAAAFRACAGMPLVRGFAVGRTIFEDVARAWLAGTVDDGAAHMALAGRLLEMAASWRAAKAMGRAA